LPDLWLIYVLSPQILDIEPTPSNHQNHSFTLNTSNPNTTMATRRLEDEFEEQAKMVHDWPQRPPEKHFFKLYALYKQAKEGDVDPSIL
jgi:hypothetical protein